MKQIAVIFAELTVTWTFIISSVDLVGRSRIAWGWWFIYADNATGIFTINGKECFCFTKKVNGSMRIRSGAVKSS
jgi:hypothetical protein